MIENTDDMIAYSRDGVLTLREEKHPKDRRYVNIVARHGDQILREFPASMRQEAWHFFDGYRMAYHVMGP
jgi:hypothetical protein